MATICSICGKKQSSFIQDFPLSKSNSEQRICAKCYEETNHVIRLSELNQNEYEKSFEYFQHLINKNIPTSEAVEELNNLKKRAEYNLSELKKEQEIMRLKEQEKRMEEEKYNNFLMTSGFEFEGYTIVRYNRVISEQVVLGTGFLSEFTASFADFFGVESNKFASKLEECRDIVTRKLIDKAINLGANAIIGIYFDYIMFSGNLIGVIINGTAVTVNALTANKI